MGMTRVSTAGVNKNTMRDIGSVMSDMVKLQKQISSEKAVDNFLDLSKTGKVEKVIDFETKIKKNEDYINNNKIILGRLKQADLAVDKILDIANFVRDSITTLRSPSGKNMEFEQLARSSLAIIQQNLNTNYEGRYIFSGAKTDVRPVGDIVNVTNMVKGTPTNNYYNGDNTVMNIQAGPSLSIKYGLKANDPAFETLIGAIHTALEGAKKKDENLVSTSMDMINDAITGVVQLRARITNDLNVVEKANDGHVQSNLYLNEIISDDIKTDIPKASLELANNEAILRATYMTFSRINQLTLTDFLK